MTAELTQEVSDRLTSDKYGWLTTVANVNGVDLEKALDKYTKRGVEGVKQ